MNAGADAFVIWIDGPSEPTAEDAAIRGRVEHLRTSARVSFTGEAELIEFLTRHFRAGCGGAEKES